MYEEYSLADTSWIHQNVATDCWGGELAYFRNVDYCMNMHSWEWIELLEIIAVNVNDFHLSGGKATPRYFNQVEDKQCIAHFCSRQTISLLILKYVEWWLLTQALRDAMAEWLRYRTQGCGLHVTLRPGVRIPVLPRVICGVALSRRLSSGGWIQST